MADPNDKINQSSLNADEAKPDGVIGASNPTPSSEVLGNTPTLPQPMALQPRLEEGSPTKSQRWMKRGKSSLVWAWKLFAELVTIVWLVALWDSYRPKITVTPGGTLNSKSPFATYFIVQNQGALPISGIRYITHLTALSTAGSSNQVISTAEQNVSVIPQMKSLESYSLSVHYAQVQINPYSSVSTNQISTNQVAATPTYPLAALLLSFDVSYEPKFFGKRTDTLYFVAVMDVDGNWQWLPTAHQSMTDQIIDTNLIPRLQPSPVAVAIPTNGSSQVHTN
jgi:hypothetical protein